MGEKFFSRLSFLVLLLTVSCAGGFKFKQSGSFDLPGWKNFRGDYQNTAYIPLTIGVPNNLLWKYNTKGRLKSSPIVVGKTVVVGSLDKRLHFLDALSGEDLGVYKVSSPISASTCAEDVTIYFGLDRGKETFFALNLVNGEVLWKERLGDLSSSPAICGDRVFVGSGPGILWALDQNTGERVWEFETEAAIISTPACNGLSSSTSSETVICFGSTDGYLYALDRENGDLRWKFKAESGIYSSPAIKNGTVFFGSVDGYLYAVSLKDGSLVWKFKTQADVYSSPAVADSLVYIGSNDYFVYAVNQKTGKLSWKFETEGLVRSSPIAVGDKLFFGSYDGNFYVVNRFSGKLLWKYQTRGMISSSPAYCDGKIYMASEDGLLYCFGY